ncbi:ATP-binding cassette domain-containing protein [Brachybacterium saurashtrense]|uniref:ATP-binding cassette domain-containing protein n=1 Tax=Brachybacterium saurashtrense TaxID=556288 RepID=UPI001F4990EF|nr:ATP-binding cassette domain-containing protein [Brachybacterium saurashtrense]
MVLPSGDGVGPWTGTVAPGEQVLVLGPSGSGKSTLLRTLAGAVPSHRRGRVTGSLRVGGIDPVAEGVRATAEVVGMLGQDPADGVCLPQVADDVALPLESRCVPPGEIGARVRAALDRAGVAALAERSAATLSGGQLQRAGLAAAAVARPRLLLLDEPTAMLDADGVRAVRDAVAAAVADGDVAVMLVEHRLDDWAGERGIAALPSRTLALDGSGRVLADGPTAQVLARHGAALREAGCWLPREIEERLDQDAASAEPGPTPPAARVPAPRAAPPGSAVPVTAPPGDGTSLLAVAGADLGHEGRTVLAGVDLEVRAGRLLAVVGRNGAGKSTLLGAMSRLDAPQRGTVEGAAAALVFQRPEAQFIADTVQGELEASGATSTQATAMLERLDLLDQAPQSPFALSGGQQRRLSLAAVLLGRRPVLLADEPGYGLDRAGQAAVLALLREAADAGRGVVMTTHDLHSVAVADAVVVIADGHLHGPMPPADLQQDRVLMQRAGLLPGPGRGTAGPEGPDQGGADDGGRAAATAPTTPSARGVTPATSSARGAAPASTAHPWLARRSPAVLLGLLTGLSVVGIALTDPVPLLILYLLLGAGAMLGCRLGPLALARAQLPFVVFAGGVFAVNVLSRPGHEPWPELPVRVTEEGIVLGTALALRVLVIGLGAVIVLRASDPRRTMISLQQHAHLPARYAYALLAGRRLLDDLPRRWRTITRAHRVRLPLTAQGDVAALRPRHLLRCAFALLVDAVRSAERIAFALESRGLGEGPRTVWRPVPLGAGDAVLAAGVVATVVLVLLLS